MQLQALPSWFGPAFSQEELLQALSYSYFSVMEASGHKVIIGDVKSQWKCQYRIFKPQSPCRADSLWYREVVDDLLDQWECIWPIWKDFFLSPLNKWIVYSQGRCWGGAGRDRRVFEDLEQVEPICPSLFSRATNDSTGGYRINHQFILKMLLWTQRVDTFNL